MEYRGTTKRIKPTKDNTKNKNKRNEIKEGIRNCSSISERFKLGRGNSSRNGISSKKIESNEGKSSLIEKINDIDKNKDNSKSVENEEIRYMANGMRGSKYHILNEKEKESLKEDIRLIGADEKIFKFNEGYGTGYMDDLDIINIRGDVLPDLDSVHPRDLMSSRAALAHEYYGHRVARDKVEVMKTPRGAWYDEFRASYMAAKNCPKLSDEDRRYLILDALERAKEAGVPIKNNEVIRSVLYGY